MRKIDEKSNFCGEMIKNKRKLENLTVDQLASKLQLEGLNVDKSFVSKVESRKVVLKDFELLLIAKVLDIDLNELKNNIEI